MIKASHVFAWLIGASIGELLVAVFDKERRDELTPSHLFRSITSTIGIVALLKAMLYFLSQAMN